MGKNSANEMFIVGTCLTRGVGNEQRKKVPAKETDYLLELLSLILEDDIPRPTDDHTSQDGRDNLLPKNTLILRFDSL